MHQLTSRLHPFQWGTMSTSFELESGLRKSSGALEASRGGLLVWARNGGDWASRTAGKTIQALKSSTWWAFLVVALAIGCVAYADSRVEDVSLGYLYILPLSFSAILLSKRLTYAIVVVCILFHDLFGPPIHHMAARILHNFTALVGFAFVVAILRWFVAQRNALDELTRHQRDELLKEVELAAEVQRLFLPRSDPETEGFEISGAMHPARGVGGDYYDFLPRPDGRMRLVIADVSGKGGAGGRGVSAKGAAGAFGGDAKEFGTVRLLASVRLGSGSSARVICEQLWLDVAAFTQRDSLSDDLTLMVIKMKSASEAVVFPAFSD